MYKIKCLCINLTMIISISFSSKNRQSLKSFIFFFKKLWLNKKLKILNRNFKQSLKIVKLTVLKSPHVNKIAQEQFEFRIIFSQLSVFSFQLFKILIVLKQIQIRIFSDIQIKTKIKMDLKKTTEIKYELFDPDNFELFPNYSNIYLNIFDCYGELKFEKC